MIDRECCGTCEFSRELRRGDKREVCCVAGLKLRGDYVLVIDTWHSCELYMRRVKDGFGSIHGDK